MNLLPINHFRKYQPSVRVLLLLNETDVWLNRMNLFF